MAGRSRDGNHARSADPDRNTRAFGARLQLPATETLAEEDGTISDAFLRFYGPIAWAGTPLIITGDMYLGPSGKATYRTPGIEHDGRLPGLRRFTELVHRHGPKLIVQLNHCGRQANPRVAAMTGRSRRRRSSRRRC